MAVRDDPIGGQFPDARSICNVTSKDPEQPDEQDKSCDDLVRDAHCVCEKPDNTARLGDGQESVGPYRGRMP